MLEKHNKYLTISLGGLTLVSILLFFFSRKESRPEIDRDYFRVTDSEKIDHISLKSNRGVVELMFDGTRWKVNSKWDADVQMIKVLMATLRQVEPHRPVAASIRDSVVRRLEQSGTRVVSYEGGKEKMNFLAGGNPLKTEAWFLKADEAQPYRMIIPGYRVYVSGILEMAEGGWRNKRIFDFNWRNFRSLAATFAQEPKQSFKVEMSQRYFGIREMARVDTARLNNYLDAVSLLMAARFVPPGEPVYDSLLSTSPLARIDITDIGDRTYSLELFRPGNADREVYGRLTGGEVVAFDRNAVLEIVRRREYFVLH